MTSVQRLSPMPVPERLVCFGFVGTTDGEKFVVTEGVTLDAYQWNLETSRVCDIVRENGAWD